MSIAPITYAGGVSAELESRLKKISVVIGIVLVILSLLNLGGWALGIDWLKPPYVGIVSMRISGAVCFLLGGASLLLKLSPNKPLQFFGLVLAAVILAISCLMIVSYFGVFDFWTVDKQFVTPAVCAFFAFAAIGILMSVRGRQDLFAFAVIGPGSLGFFTRVFGIRIFHEDYGFGFVHGGGVDTYLSLLACAMLALFGFGVLISNPRTALFGLLCSTTRGGFIIRRIIPLAVGVPMIWAAAATAGEFAHWYNQPVRWTLFVNGTIVSFCLLSCYIAKRLVAVDRSRIVLAEKRADIVYSLAHDLKVPIIGATQSLDLLLKEALGQLQTPQRTLLSVLRDSMSDQLWMIENLVYEYQTEQGREVISLSTCFVDKLLDDCLEKIMAALQAKNLEVKVNHANPDIPLQADPVALRRVINNLLHNALKHCPRGGNIEIRSSTDSECFSFTVWNSGPAISDAQKQHLFERFWQSEEGHSRHIGNGLGLYICRQIINAHSGSISCSSEQNEGTAFTVVLPIHRSIIAEQ